MNHLYQRFSKGILWNIFEAAGYHIIFLIHQIALFHYCEKSLYGKMGTIFALIYAIGAIANFGLDFSLAPFFNEIKKSRTFVKSLLIPQYVIQWIIIVATAMITFSYIESAQPVYWFIIAITIIESIRKSLRIILQLSFMNHITSIGEVVGFIVYSSMIWTLYNFYGNLSLPIIFIPFIIVYGISVIIFAIFLYQEYKKLPSQADIEYDPELPRRIVTLRACTTIYTIGHQLFSSNILLPWIALHGGFVQAGIWHLITSITYTINSVVHKIGGFASQALLAAIKSTTMNVKKETFSLITSQLNQVIYTIIIFMVINYKKILVSHAAIDNGSCWLFPAYLYLAITIIEQLYIAYEKFYINEESVTYLIISHLFTIGTSLFLMYHVSISVVALLATLLGIRIISFVSLAVIAYRMWGIKPNWKINMWLSLLIAAGSLLFNICF